MRTNGASGFSFLELKRHVEKLLKDNNTATSSSTKNNHKFLQPHHSHSCYKSIKGYNTATQAHPQRTITSFFSPITPTHATSQSRATQMGSQPRLNKRVTIDRAIAICRACKPLTHGPRPYHLCHRHIKAIISSHRKCFPRCKNLSILHRPMLEIFRRQML